MVALQYGWGDSPARDVDEARRQVAWLSDDLPRTLLGADPSTIRRRAAAALDAGARADRRRARLGTRPDLDDDTAGRALDAADRVADAEQRRSWIGRRRHRWLAAANGGGLAAFGAAGGLVILGLSPFSSPVGGLVITAACGPVAVATYTASQRARAAYEAAQARDEAAAALERTGFATLGQLRARRLAVDCWERRRAEADAADAAAQAAVDEWHRLAGPHFSPVEADALVARLRVLRSAQLRLLSALLHDHLVERRDGAARPAVDDPPGDEVVADSRPHEWLSDVLDRIRGRHLQLWR